VQLSEADETLPALTYPKSLKGLLRGKVGVVTGASRGIGAGTAWSLAEAGAKVVLGARDAVKLAIVSKSINAEYGDVSLAIETDVTDPAAVQKLIQETVSAFGRLDFAFNNAGDGHLPAAIADISLQDFNRVIQTNVVGTFLSIKYEIPEMLKTGGGSIVNMSSTAGVQGVNGIGGYTTAKHAIIGLTRSAAMDYARQNIRVNVVAPGPILTERSVKFRDQAAQGVPLGRVGSREEVATVVSWLCSDLSTFVTGAVIPIDGGRTAGVWFERKM
jgi:NAD(P)-dependent dehydrogenase (short-subunit alcohol dehydrogenase family)